MGAQFIVAAEFIEHLKRENLVIVPRAQFEKNNFGGLSLAEFQKQTLQKKLLSFREISKAKLWGDLGQKAVYMLAKELLPEEDLIRLHNSRLIKVPRVSVKSIAVARGTLFFEV